MLLPKEGAISRPAPKAFPPTAFSDPKDVDVRLIVAAAVVVSARAVGRGVGIGCLPECDQLLARVAGSEPVGHVAFRRQIGQRDNLQAQSGRRT